MMKTILVPTDFSENAKVAAAYALGFAKHNEYNIHFLHAYLPFKSGFQSPSANESHEREARQECEERMRKFQAQLEIKEGESISFSIKKGHLVNVINTFMETNPVAVVVMGTHGESGTRKDIIGSNTYDVAKSIAVPLLVVPENNQGFQLDRVVFFTDFQKGDIKSLQALKSITPQEEPACTLVHINPKAADSDQASAQKLDEWKASLQTQCRYENMESELVSEREDIDTVHSIITRIDADLAVLTLVEGRNFFEKLMKKSLARAIVLNPTTPVLLCSGD